MTQEKDPPKSTGLGEAMGVIIILFLLLPFTDLTMRATTEIITRPTCGATNNDK